MGDRGRGGATGDQGGRGPWVIRAGGGMGDQGGGVPWVIRAGGGGTGDQGGRVHG